MDPRYKIRQYIGLWGTVDGDGVEYAVKPKSFTARSLVGMTMGARKRAHRAAMVGLDYEDGVRFTLTTSTKYRIGERLRPCPGCCACGVIEPGNEYQIPWCDGSGVLPARRSK